MRALSLLVRVQAVTTCNLCNHVKNLNRINVDAHFVLWLGAKVNNNKCRVRIAYTEREGGGITDR